MSYRYEVFLCHSSADQTTVARVAKRLTGDGVALFFADWHIVPGTPWQEAVEEALEESGSCVVFVGAEGLGPWQTEELRVALEERVRNPEVRVLPVLLPGAPDPENLKLPRFLRRLRWVDLATGDGYSRLLGGIRGHAPEQALQVSPLDPPKGTRQVSSLDPPKGARQRPAAAAVETVVYLDMSRYSAISRSLELGHQMGARATQVLNEQIVALVRHATVDATVDFERVFLKGTGDGAILAFATPADADRFAVALHERAARHSRQARHETEHRCFRIGIYTGEIIRTADGDVAGVVVGFAARLEAAGRTGQILIDADSWSRLSPAQQQLYGDVETVRGKAHDPTFEVHRRQVVAPAPWEGEGPKLPAEYRSMALPPDGFVHRHELDEIAALLCDAGEDADRTVGITTALRGAGGFGKTTLAQALAGDERVRQAFPDGVLWTTMGAGLRDDEPRTRILDLLRIWTREESPDVQTVADAGRYLRDVLAGQRVLVVVDDVWSSADIEPFCGLGKSAALLITTRDRQTLPSECQRVDIDAMRRPEAVKLLASGLGDAEDALLEPLAQRLGEWPLLLKLVNRQLRLLVRDHDLTLDKAIEHVKGRLARGLEKLDVRRAKKREEAVALTMQASLDALSPGNRDRYLELAVFPEDIDVPLDVLARLWVLDEAETEDLCGDLFNLSLLLRLDLSSNRIRLHDVFREYLLGRQGDLPGLHRSFLGLCCPQSGRWSDLDPGDGYLWYHLAYHLAAAGEEDVLRGLLFDFAYLRGKLAATDVNALLGDYDLLPGDDEARDVQGALRLAAHLLGRDLGHLNEQHLAGQLLGRLLGRGEPGVGRLLEAAAKVCVLRPRFASLGRPGGPLIRTLDVGPVSVVAVLGENRVVSAYDPTLRVWDLASGETIRTLEGHTEWVSAVAVLDENCVVSASYDTTLRVWDLATGETIRTLRGHTNSVLEVAVLAENRVVSASDDNTLRVWDLATGETIRTLEGYTEEIGPMAVLDENRVVSGREVYRPYASTLFVWDVASDEAIPTSQEHSSGTSLVALDENRVVSACYDNILCVWDLASGEPIRTLRGHTDSVLSVAVLAESRIVSASDDNTLRVWDLASGEKIRTLKGHTEYVGVVAVLDENRVVSASYDTTLRVWDLATGETIRTLKGHTDRVHAVAALNENSVVSASDDNTLRVWDLGSGETIRTLEGHTEWVHAVAVLNENRVISASNDNTLRVWDLATGETIRILEGHTEWVDAVAVLNENRVVSASDDTTLCVWDLATGETIRTLEGHTQLVCAVAVLDENRVVSAAYDTTLRVWDLATGETIRTLRGHWAGAVAILDENCVVSASGDKTLRVWDIDAGRDVAIFTLDAPATAVACDASGQVVVAGDSVGGVHFLELVGSSSA